MTIKELKSYVDNAYEKGENCNVECWIKLDDNTEVLADIDSIGQFSIVPDMTLCLKPLNTENKIYTTSIIDESQFEYREKYKKLCKKIINLYNDIDN